MSSLTKKSTKKTFRKTRVFVKTKDSRDWQGTQRTGCGFLSRVVVIRGIGIDQEYEMSRLQQFELQDEMTDLSALNVQSSTVSVPTGGKGACAVC